MRDLIECAAWAVLVIFINRTSSLHLKGRMGLNVDLTHLLGISSERRCEKCKGLIESRQLEEFDIESPSCNPLPGVWVLGFYCHECEYYWEEKIKLRAELF